MYLFFIRKNVILQKNVKKLLKLIQKCLTYGTIYDILYMYTGNSVLEKKVLKMTKEQIKKMIEEIQKYINALEQDKDTYRKSSDPSMYHLYCEIEGEIFARYQIIDELKKYL